MKSIFGFRDFDLFLLLGNSELIELVLICIVIEIVEVIVVFICRRWLNTLQGYVYAQDQVRLYVLCLLYSRSAPLKQNGKLSIKYHFHLANMV